MLYALAKSQACADGNKRVALILVFEFLAQNATTVEVDPDELADMIRATAESAPSEHEQVVSRLTVELEPLIVPLTMEDA